MRRARSAFFVASLAAVAAGCADAPQAPSARPTAPSLAVSEATAGACAPATARTIYGEINTLLAGKDQTQARSLFREVEATCASSDLAPAEAKAAAYYRFFLTVYRATPSRVRAVDPAAASAVHFENVASYIGQATHFVAQHFTTGAIGVCPTLAGSTARCILKTGDNEAGISVPYAALPGGTARLFSIAPAVAVGTACKSENLEGVGACYQFDVTPDVSPEQPFLADVALSVCVDDGRGTRLRLAHPEPRRPTTSEIEVTPPVDLAAAFGTEAFPTPPCGLQTSRDLAPAGPGLVAAWHRLGALAARGWSLLGPRTAYAVHAGVGGGVRELSPFRAVDPLVFAGTFDDPASFPLGALRSPVDDERGTWTSSVESPPGSITVAESLGDLGTAAGDQIVVLNQGGGACTACSKLHLTGTLRPQGGNTATTGRYRVEWSTVQAKETSKFAPIDLQDGAGRVLARLAYRTVGSANQLVAFGRDATTLLPVEVVLGRWTVNTANTFVLEVDLEAKRFVVVSVTPALASPVVLPRTLLYLNEFAAGLDRYVIAFGGIDAGILGLDDVRIRRLPDR